MTLLLALLLSSSAYACDDAVITPDDAVYYPQIDDVIIPDWDYQGDADESQSY